MLKPRSVRELFALSLMLYRHRIGFLLKASICILLPYYVVYAYVVTHNQFLPSQDVQQLVDSGNQLVVPLGTQVWLVVLAAIYLFLVFPILFGMVSHMTDKTLRKESDVTVSDAGNVAFHRFFPNMLTLLLTALIYVVGACVFAFVVGLLASALGATTSVLGVVITVLGAIVLLIGAIWYSLRVLFIPAIVVEEGISYLKAFRRSFSLTRYQTKRIFGFCVMLFIITFVIETFLTVIGSVILGGGGGQLLVTAVISIFVTPFTMVCLSMLYSDLRIRKGE